MIPGRAPRFTTPTLIAITALGLLGIGPDATADPRPVSAVPQSVAGQALRWRGCIDPDAEPGLPVEYYRLECATLFVPLDWDEPTGALIKIAVSRLPASISPAQGVLFTNPGGPGGAGIGLPLLFVSDARKNLLRSQDIYGIDVRGTGGSANVTCGRAGSMLLDPRDRSEPNLDLLLDDAQFTARACDVAGGTLIDHVTTAATVRDLDLLRSVVRAPTVNWLGFSAGTWLGAQYATAYPEHVGHMVLDSNLDFTGTWQQAFQLQPAGFERRFRADFLPWAAKYDDVFGLGTSADAVEASYERIRAALLPDVPIDNAVVLDQLIAGALYSKYLFPLAATVLADLDGLLRAQGTADSAAMKVARGRITAALPLLRSVSIGAAQPFASDASGSAFLAVTCNDTPWVGDRAALVTGSEQAGERAPLIGWATVTQPCAFWHRPAVSTPVPDGVGVPPVLMVQSERDPATPIEGARRAASRFAGARMLTVTHEGDHGLYASGNTCVNRAVERFIMSGTLPREGATCVGKRLPNPRPASMFAQGTGVGGSAGIPAPGTNALVALRMLSALVG